MRGPLYCNLDVLNGAVTLYYVPTNCFKWSLCKRNSVKYGTVFFHAKEGLPKRLGLFFFNISDIDIYYNISILPRIQLQVPSATHL